MTSHGGNNFLRIRTKSVILSDELNRTFWEMYLKQRYKEILFILDTCEAVTAFDAVTAPNIFFVGSSLKDQKALSYGFDEVLMTPLSDRFTFLFSHFLDNILHQRKFEYSMKDFFDQVSIHKDFLNSELGIKNGIVRDVILLLTQ
jgi:phosphatidylinositol glycan class K